MPDENLLKRFDDAMMNIYLQGRALKPPYVASDFHNLLMSKRGLQTARDFLSTTTPQSGFTHFYLRNVENPGTEHLTLTVEFLVLQDPWCRLFTKEELQEARRRLVEHKFSGELPHLQE